MNALPPSERLKERSGMRVVVLTHGFYPRIGGVERLVASISPMLQRRGVQVHILTRRLPATPPYEEFDGIPVHRLPASGPKGLASAAFTLSSLALIARLRPNLIHAHELISPATTALLARRLWGCPIVATVHRSGPLGDVTRMKSRKFGKLRLQALRRDIDRFVVISQEIDNELAGEGVPAARRRSIPNGVDVCHFAPVEAPTRKALRQKMDLPVEGELVIFAGRLAPEKRLDLLVRVWPMVRAIFPRACLLIVGAGPQEAELKAQAGQIVACGPSGFVSSSNSDGCQADAIRWLGVQKDLAPFYQACDLFVLPSSAEGASVALLEAMACGLPALATSVGGAPEVIEHKASGWLIPPGDREALQAGLLTLLGDPQQRSRLGRNARQHILAHYSLESTAEQLYNLYRELVVEGRV